MPLDKKQFQIIQDNLVEAIDVDASDGRSVPINMNFTDTGYLTKDTGFTLFGLSDDDMSHSLFNYEKKNGTSYIIRAKGTVLQRYSTVDRAWNDIPSSPTFTEDAEFGYAVYNDELWAGNGYEAHFKWDGTTFTTYSSAPKGNIYEIFEDRLFISGVIAEPLSVYYSDIATPQTFQSTSVVKPLGTDALKALKNYYGTLMMFKTESIWKLTFIYDQVAGAFIPKLELQSSNYGACSRKAVSWVENDLWFFTGREVRAIGFKDQQTGVFGINNSVISEGIKETLKLIDKDNYEQCVSAYNNRRFYLSVPLDDTTTDTTFVCHTLYKNSWTKYTDRDKARIKSFLFIDGDVYSSTSSTPYLVIDWQVDAEDIADQNNSLATES